MPSESKSTPTTEEVREYVGRAEVAEYKPWEAPTPADVEVEKRRISAFDRWLAEVRAEAWDEGLAAGCDRWMDSREFGNEPVNPYKNLNILGENE